MRSRRRGPARLLPDMTPGLADHGHQLAFVVELGRYARANDRHAMVNQALRETCEDGRIVRRLDAGLGEVGRAIETETEDLGRLG